MTTITASLCKFGTPQRIPATTDKKLWYNCADCEAEHSAVIHDEQAAPILHGCLSAGPSFWDILLVGDKFPFSLGLFCEKHLAARLEAAQ